MTAEILDGKRVSASLRDEIAAGVSAFTHQTGRKPVLAAVLVGEDPASQVYVRNKEKACAKAGIESRLSRLTADTSEVTLLELIEQLNRDEAVDGILVQMPLPRQIDPQRVLDAIDPGKDVDAFHAENVGLLVQGRPRFLPCTPHGVLEILRSYDLSVRGKHAVVLGRSDIVGKPMGILLVQRDSECGPERANATVTICHSGTTDLPSITRSADLLVAAIGKPKFVTAEMVKPGAIVIDVGINRTEEGLVGDVDFDAVKEVASAITPVPGGVGPLTVTILLENTLRSARLRSV